jgi:hypothetical protein
LRSLTIIIFTSILSGCFFKDPYCENLKTAFRDQHLTTISKWLGKAEFQRTLECKMESPLWFAARWKDRELTEKLLKLDFNPYYVTSANEGNEYQTIWNWISNGWFDLVPEDFRFHYREVVDGDNALLHSCYQHSIIGIEYLIDKGLGINTVDTKGYSCAHYIQMSTRSTKSPPPSFDKLVGFGLSLNQINDLGLTALNSAVRDIATIEFPDRRANALTLIEKLIHAGACPDMKTHRTSALKIAKRLNDPEVLKIISSHRCANTDEK